MNRKIYKKGAKCYTTYLPQETIETINSIAKKKKIRKNSVIINAIAYFNCKNEKK